MHLENNRVRVRTSPGNDTSATRWEHAKRLRAQALECGDEAEKQRIMAEVQRIEAELQTPITGTVVRVFAEKGFCFIKRDDTGGDLFLHVNDLCTDVAFDDTLVERQLAFEVANGPNGKQRAVKARSI